MKYIPYILLLIVVLLCCSCRSQKNVTEHTKEHKEVTERDSLLLRLLGQGNASRIETMYGISHINIKEFSEPDSAGRQHLKKETNIDNITKAHSEQEENTLLEADILAGSQKETTEDNEQNINSSTENDSRLIQKEEWLYVVVPVAVVLLIFLVILIRKFRK